MKPKLTVTADFTDQFNELVKQFRRDAVLVGIPQGSVRKDDEINNATLLAINEFGSPMNNIPPRPVMSIGIRKAQDEIAEQFRTAVKDVLKKGGAAIRTYYERAGIVAANSIKKVINAQDGIKPPAASTLSSRKSKGFAGTKSLIVTGQMRNAITYVVKEGP